MGGSLKGRNLLSFKGEKIRPTLDSVRESLFNIIQFNIENKSFLDLFSGTGAVGIEALSRGASEVLFNDLDRESVALTKENLKKCKIENAVVKNCDAEYLIESLNKKFDYVFIDAPYKSLSGLNALKKAHLILNEDGIVIFENEQPFNEDLENLYILKEKKYGRVYLTFFKLKEN